MIMKKEQRKNKGTNLKKIYLMTMETDLSKTTFIHHWV